MPGLRGAPGPTAPSPVSLVLPIAIETVPIRGHKTEGTTAPEITRMSRNALFAHVQVSMIFLYFGFYKIIMHLVANLSVNAI